MLLVLPGVSPWSEGAGVCPPKTVGCFGGRTVLAAPALLLCSSRGQDRDGVLVLGRQGVSPGMERSRGGGGGPPWAPAIPCRVPKPRQPLSLFLGVLWGGGGGESPPRAGRTIIWTHAGPGARPTPSLTFRGTESRAPGLWRGRPPCPRLQQEHTELAAQDGAGAGPPPRAASPPPHPSL